MNKKAAAKAAAKTTAKKNVDAMSCVAKVAVNEGGIVKDAGSQRDNKTGSWRSFRPIVSVEKCTGCNTCVLYCPDAAIKLVDKGGKKKAEVNYDYCKGCLICEAVCPFKAITNEVEKK